MKTADRERLKSQINKTLTLLINKEVEADEPIIARYISDYQSAALSLENENVNPRCLSKLLHCARGYLETSSDWQQPFLDAMGETEAMITQVSIQDHN